MADKADRRKSVVHRHLRVHPEVMVIVVIAGCVCTASEDDDAIKRGKEATK